MLLSGVIALGGLSQVLSGAVTSFPMLCAMRSLHGACFSMTIPLLSSLVRDYFPQERRGTANSLLYSANYFGTALSSISVLFISSFGWRSLYGLMGGFGLFVGLLTALFVKNPKPIEQVTGETEIVYKEDESVKKKENIFQRFSSGFLDVVKNKTTKYILFGGMLRHFSDAAIAGFLPVYFLRSYPNFKAQYSMINAFSLTVFGFISNLMAGLIGDKFEKTNPMAKGWITCLSTLLSIPFIFLCCAPHGNFWISIISIAAYILVSGGYHATAVTMIENTVSSEDTGKMVSSWQLYTNLCQTVSPAIFSFIAAAFNAKANPAYFGKILIAFIAAGYIPSAYMFYKGGKEYSKLMKER